APARPELANLLAIDDPVIVVEEKHPLEAVGVGNDSKKDQQPWEKPCHACPGGPTVRCRRDANRRHRGGMGVRRGPLLRRFGDSRWHLGLSAAHSDTVLGTRSSRR